MCECVYVCDVMSIDRILAAVQHAVHHTHQRTTRRHLWIFTRLCCCKDRAANTKHHTHHITQHYITPHPSKSKRRAISLRTKRHSLKVTIEVRTVMIGTAVMQREEDTCHDLNHHSHLKSVTVLSS